MAFGKAEGGGAEHAQAHGCLPDARGIRSSEFFMGSESPLFDAEFLETPFGALAHSGIDVGGGGELLQFPGGGTVADVYERINQGDLDQRRILVLDGIDQRFATAALLANLSSASTDERRTLTFAS